MMTVSEKKDMNNSTGEYTAEEKETCETECIDVEINEDTIEDLNDESGDSGEKEDELAKRIEEALCAANDKYLRLMAEYDNYRKRTAKEKTDAYGDATIDCMAEIIPVIDNFERALGAECSDDKYKNGITMIFNQFRTILEKLGIKEIECLNQPFDPNLHNAIKRMDDENFEENMVCEVYQKGYTLGDKVLRYAMVAVAN